MTPRAFPDRTNALRWALLVPCVLLTIAACSNGETASDAASDPTSGAATASPSASGGEAAACDVLSRDDVAQMAGDPTADPETKSIVGFPTCVWPLTDGYVQVAKIPAADWATQLPPLIEQLKSSGMQLTAADRRELDKAVSLVEGQESISAADACDIFAVVMRAQGATSDPYETVQVIPSTQDPQAISGQSCVDGYFTTVTLIQTSLDGSAEEVAAVKTALEQANQQ